MVGSELSVDVRPDLASSQSRDCERGSNPRVAACLNLEVPLESCLLLCLFIYVLTLVYGLSVCLFNVLIELPLESSRLPGAGPTFLEWAHLATPPPGSSIRGGEGTVD